MYVLRIFTIIVIPIQLRLNWEKMLNFPGKILSYCKKSFMVYIVKSVPNVMKIFRKFKRVFFS